MDFLVSVHFTWVYSVAMRVHYKMNVIWLLIFGILFRFPIIFSIEILFAISVIRKNVKSIVNWYSHWLTMFRKFYCSNSANLSFILWFSRFSSIFSWIRLRLVELALSSYWVWGFETTKTEITLKRLSIPAVLVAPILLLL
jgi:hypothetical protein